MTPGRVFYTKVSSMAGRLPTNYGAGSKTDEAQKPSLYHSSSTVQGRCSAETPGLGKAVTCGEMCTSGVAMSVQERPVRHAHLFCGGLLRCAGGVSVGIHMVSPRSWPYFSSAVAHNPFPLTFDSPARVRLEHQPAVVPTMSRPCLLSWAPDTEAPLDN